MTSLEPLTPPPPPATVGDIVDEIVPVAGLILVEGPPVIYVLAPWLLLGLMLSAPFAVLVVFAVAAAVAAVLLVALAGVVATPYLLLRGLRRRYLASRPIVPAGAHAATLDPRQVIA